MSLARIFAVVALLSLVIVTGLAAYQGGVSGKAGPQLPTRPSFNEALWGKYHEPDPCQMNLGINYYDGKTKPSKWQLGLNYVDGKASSQKLPLFQTSASQSRPGYSCSP